MIELQEGGIITFSQEELEKKLKSTGVNLLECNLHPIHKNSRDIDSYELRFSYTSSHDNFNTLIEEMKALPSVKQIIMEENLGIISFVDGVEVNVR